MKDPVLDQSLPVDWLMTNCATVLLTAETMMVSLPVESEGMLVEETVDL